jgi:hypothetical protein
MGWVGHVECMAVMRNMYKILIRKPEGKRLLKKIICIWEDNIIMDLSEVGWEGVI